MHHEDARAERAVMSHADAYRLVEEAREMREERDAARLEVERLRVALAEIAEGCGHARCHAYPWIRAARKALA